MSVAPVLNPEQLAAEHAALLADPSRRGKVYRALVAAAAAGADCPRNADLSEMLGIGTGSTPSLVINQLELRGVLAVQRTQTTRRVTVLATGHSTAPLAPETRTAVRRKFRISHERVVGEHHEVRLAVRPPDRTPCHKCGVRADVGCAHQVSSVVADMVRPGTPL